MEGETQKNRTPQEVIEAWLEKTRREGAQRIRQALNFNFNLSSNSPNLQNPGQNLIYNNNPMKPIEPDPTPNPLFPDPNNPQNNSFSLKNPSIQIIQKNPYPPIKKKPPEKILPNPNFPPKQ